MRCIRDTPQRPYLPLGHEHHSVSSRNHCPSWGHACSGLASHSRNSWERDKLVTNICSFNGKDKTQAIVKKPTVYPCVLKRVDDCRELCSRPGKTRLFIHGEVSVLQFGFAFGSLQALAHQLLSHPSLSAYPSDRKLLTDSPTNYEMVQIKSRLVFSPGASGVRKAVCKTSCPLEVQSRRGRSLFKVWTLRRHLVCTF